MDGGRKHGPAIRYDSRNVITARLHYVDGVLDGPYASGEVRGTYKAGTPHGRWSITSADRRRSFVAQFVDGVADGPYERKDDIDQASGAYAAGKRIGPWTYRWASGAVMARGSYVDDKRVGEWVFWHPADDRVAAKGTYVAGERQHDWTFFAADGSRSDEATALQIKWLANAIADDDHVEAAVIETFMHEN